MPLVSVVIAFHRDQPFFRPAIASVLGQTLRDLELVLVDNGTGISADALGEFGRDPRVRWVRLERNEGIPAGHNAGVAAATGEFVALQDYDDISLPHRLERQVAALQADRDVRFVSGLAERIDEHDRAIGSVLCFAERQAQYVYSQYAGVVITAVGMAPKEIFRRWPYRPEFPFAADLDFQARLVESGRMVVLPEVLLRYRWYRTQTTQANAASIEQSRCVIQLTTARRRAGRLEALAAAVAAVAAPAAAETWRRGAALSLHGGFHALAAYQARRSLALERSIGAAMAAFRLARAAWREAPKRDRALVAKLFLRGPIRAHGLRPA